jgi:hypothetical protein
MWLLYKTVAEKWMPFFVSCQPAPDIRLLENSSVQESINFYFFFLLSVMTNDRKGWQALDNVMTVEFNTVYTSWGKAVFTNKNKIKQLQYNRMHDLRLEATPKYVLNYCSLLGGRFNSFFSTKFIKANWLHCINSKPAEKTEKSLQYWTGHSIKHNHNLFSSQSLSSTYPSLLLYLECDCVLGWGMFI